MIFDEEYKTLEYISLKKSLPEGPFKPISLTKTFEDEEFGDVPFKTERYYRKQKAREIEEIKSLKGRIAKVIKRKEELALQEKITEEPFSIFTAGFYVIAIISYYQKILKFQKLVIMSIPNFYQNI